MCVCVCAGVRVDSRWSVARLRPILSRLSAAATREKTAYERPCKVCSSKTKQDLSLLLLVCLSVCLLAGMLCSRLQGRASRSLVGLGRQLARDSEDSGLVSRTQLRQALREYHISLTQEVRRLLADFQSFSQSMSSVLFLCAYRTLVYCGSCCVLEGMGRRTAKVCSLRAVSVRWWAR